MAVSQTPPAITNQAELESENLTLKAPRILRLSDAELDAVVGGLVSDAFSARRCPPTDSPTQ